VETHAQWKPVNLGSGNQTLVMHARNDDDVFLSEMLPKSRASTITSLVSRVTSTLVTCSDEKFTEHVAVISKLLELWLDGDDVELRCNEPPQLITAQLSPADVQLLANSQTAPGLSMPYHVFR